MSEYLGNVETDDLLDELRRRAVTETEDGGIDTLSSSSIAWCLDELARRFTTQRRPKKVPLERRRTREDAIADYISRGVVPTGTVIWTNDDDSTEDITAEIQARMGQTP